MSAFLPQNDPHIERRRRDLAAVRKQYRWNHTYVSPLSMVEDVPIRDEWAFQWVVLVGARAFDILENQLSLARDQGWLQRLRRWTRLFTTKVRYSRLDGKGLNRLLQDVVAFTIASGRPQSLADYADLFRKIQLPPINRHFRDDRVFANMRVAGPNPLMIQRVTQLDDRFPVSREHFQSVLSNDSLEAAGQEGRLYLADYRMLESVESGSFPDAQKYVYAPLALFAVEKGSKQLVPVAIQCRQRPGSDNPILTPRHGANWLIAKTIVEMADGNMHEAVSHLARTHLFVEPFAVASGRQLAASHPLQRLLRPHFEGTLAINDAAQKFLINKGGLVDRLLAGTIETTRGLAVQGLQDYPFNQVILPETFKARGVDDPDLLPDYPYRDDSLLFWRAIRQWVSDYLALYYHSDADVQQDGELGSWFADLVSQEGGRVVGFGQAGSIGTLEYLVDAITLIIYTSSVQHAAVNFPQYDLMSYCPNMPLAAYREAPTGTTGASQQDYLNMLPPLERAELVMNGLYVLGSVHYTTLGKYETDQFGDGRVESLLLKFQAQLSEIEAIVLERNRHRRPYPFLVPSSIPQSINI